MIIIGEQQVGGGGMITNNSDNGAEAGGGVGQQQQVLVPPPLGGFQNHYSNHHYFPAASSLTMHLPPPLDEGHINNTNTTTTTNNFSQPKKSTTNFDQRMEELRLYKATYGHLNIKRDTHKCLYDFCSNVRSSVTLAQQQKASGNNGNMAKQRIKLTSARMVALASIGFPWEKTKGRPPRSDNNTTTTTTTTTINNNNTTTNVNGFDDSTNKQKVTFEERIEHLREYKLQHGHTNVRLEQNKSLYAFCHNIRNARRTPGKLRAKVTDYRIAALDAIGFDWRLSSGKQSHNQEKELHIAVDQNDGEDNNYSANPNLPTNLTEAFGGTDNLPIIAGQQQQQLQYDGSLSIPTIPLFNPTLSLHQNEGYNNNNNNNTITTNTKRSTSFDVRIEELSTYKKQHGHINIKRHENKRLYDFISNIRTSLKYLTKKEDKEAEKVGAIVDRSSKKCPRINLTTERMVALASVGFVWETPKGRPPATSGGHNNMSNNSNNHGATTNNTTTTKSSKISFEERIEHLRSYKSQHGHLNIKVEEDRSLYTFCHNIRNTRRSKRGGGNDLTNNRLAALDAIGFDWRLKKQQEVDEGGISNNYDSNNNNMDPLSWSGGGEQEDEESAMI